MKKKFPIIISSREEQNNLFRVATSIDKLNELSKSIRQELSYIEFDYTVLIKTIRLSLSLSSDDRRIDPRSYWFIGDNIVRFIDRMSDIGFYIVKQNSTLSRDIGISESSIEKIIYFRRRFSKLSMIDPTISWAKYRDNKVPIPDEKI